MDCYRHRRAEAFILTSRPLCTISCCRLESRESKPAGYALAASRMSSSLIAAPGATLDALPRCWDCVTDAKLQMWLRITWLASNHAPNSSTEQGPNSLTERPSCCILLSDRARVYRPVAPNHPSPSIQTHSLAIDEQASVAHRDVPSTTTRRYRLC